MDDMEPNLEHAINIQDKFHFYFLALVFTILGLAVQTSHYFSKPQAIIEVCSWALLLSSGLAGLSRMEWLPVGYENYSKLLGQKTLLREANTGRQLMHESGKIMAPLEAGEFIKEVSIRMEERSVLIGKIERKHRIQYFIHKWLFVIGLLCLAISRAIGLFLTPLSHITR